MKPILRDFPDTLETERLIIRAPRPGDGPALNEAVRESWPELREWLPWAAGDVHTLEESESWVRSGHARFMARRDLPLLLFEKESGLMVGGSGLHRIDWSVPHFEIGYWLRTSSTGRGYMTEAVAAITNFAFDILGAQRVAIHVLTGNVRSAAVPRRLGFVHEGTLRHFRRHHLTDELVDMMIFAVLKDEWRGRV